MTTITLALVPVNVPVGGVLSDSQLLQLQQVFRGADSAQTLVDRQATAADALQTGQDRVQTGLDRTQTGLDKAATRSARALAKLALTGY